ncbi:MAG: DUF262 domain-containing protein [Myxococcales bacterium]
MRWCSTGTAKEPRRPGGSRRAGSATAGAVTNEVIKRLALSEDKLAETTTNGQSRVRNQIGWARFYLSKADMIRAPRRGVWTLTRKGLETKLDEEDKIIELFKGVQARFKKVGEDNEGTEPIPDEDEAAETGDEDSEEETDEIHEPYDPSKTHIVTKPMSVEQLAKRLNYDEIDLAPGFQRKADLWTDDKKSRLIESMLIRIPLPVFYFDATDDTKWLVVDGLQRLSTIRHFMVERDPSKRLRLQGLEYLRQHEGRTFDALPRDFQRRIEETQVFAHLIQPGTPIEVKYNIFKRINTGGLVLTAQEIRHALYQKNGGATHLLRELANSAEFLDATNEAIDKERMLDCEFVLRFVSFSLTPYTQYTEANMDAFLNRHMQRLNDDGECAARDDLRRRFRQAMRAARQLFGEDAFRKRLAAGDRRKPINKALFEAWSVALGNLDPALLEKLVAAKETVKREFAGVLSQDREFEAAVTQGTRDVKRVRKRFSTVEKIIVQTLGDSP